MEKMTLYDKVCGSLIGGAIGDALGYPVEFLSYYHIVKKYGDGGVRGFCEFNRDGKAVFSDETQMTLFTANGLLFGITRWCTHGMLADLPCYVREAYKEWYETQVGVRDYRASHTCWLRDVKELNVRRAPGSTCMNAMMNICDGKEAKNDSKGCGGMMRVAPVALQIASEMNRGNKGWSEKAVVIYASECATITHKHPMGYVSAAVFADILFQIVMADRRVRKDELIGFIDKSMEDVRQFYKENEKAVFACSELRSLLNGVVKVSESSLSDYEGIRKLGEGWSGDEALAIALFCTLRHIDDFNAAVCAAVNHDGDSDTTGSICGNIMGAIIGKNSINFPDIDRLELADLIKDLARDICDGCNIDEYHQAETSSERQWERRYVFADPRPVVKFLSKYPRYEIIDKAERWLMIKSMMKKVPYMEDYDAQCVKAYDLARMIFEKYSDLEPDLYFEMKSYLPAYYWGYEDKVYSPDNCNRVFKLNVKCYEGKSKIIAVRDDCGVHKMKRGGGFEYKLWSGLEFVVDESLNAMYPEWLLLKINPDTADRDGMAVFTNRLEKEFVVEVAHLGNDGQLHHIYVLNYL